MAVLSPQVILHSHLEATLYKGFVEGHLSGDNEAITSSFIFPIKNSFCWSKGWKDNLPVSSLFFFIFLFLFLE